ncbi:MAG: L,D-transpeptidase [Planctomycetota bacterium]
MRLVFVLLIAGALIWGYLNFVPESDTQAGEPPTVELEADWSEPLPEVVTDPEPPAPASAAAKRPELPAVASNPFSPEARAGRTARALRVAVAEAVAHGPENALAEALRGAEGVLEADRIAGLKAFERALSGDVGGARTAAAELVSSDAIPAGERGYLAAALGAGSIPPLELEPRSEVERAMAMRLHLVLARFDQQEGRYADSARRVGRALRLEFDAPWAIDAASMNAWSDELREAQRRHRWDPRGDWAGIELVAEPGDSWIVMRQRALRERPELDISAGLIARSNGSDLRSTLRVGQRVRIPTEPVSVRIDVSERWLLYMIGDEVVDSYQVGVGREGEETLTGDFTAGLKQKEPMFWGVSPPVPFGDPDNPLGTRWIGWRIEGEEADTSYGLHGTWEPESIGTASSEGCVRMRNENMETLFDIIPTGAQIIVRV